MLIHRSFIWSKKISIPSNPGSKFGKAPESGGDFLYFSNNSYTFYIDPAVSNYNPYSIAISNAFNSWNVASKVEFTENSQGLKLTAEDLGKWPASHLV